MNMERKYVVAGHCFGVLGKALCEAVSGIEGFKPFLLPDDGKEMLFTFEESVKQKVPSMLSVQYTFEYEDVTGTFGTTDQGYLLSLKPCEEDALFLWHVHGEDKVYLHGNLTLRLFRFALWVGYGLMTLPFDTIAIHSSCIVWKDGAVLFLGESGTGKSTHTRLWREHIPDAVLLNDDSPILRVEDGRVMVYGSPWSGKTPCYKPQCYELKAGVRLSQAPFNRMRRLSVLQGYGAIHPSCPPEFAYDEVLYDKVSEVIGKVLSAVPFYHLECLPDKEAALLSCKTIFEEG